MCGEGRQPEIWEPPDGGAGREGGGRLGEGGCAKEPRLMTGGGRGGADLLPLPLWGLLEEQRGVRPPSVGRN